MRQARLVEHDPGIALAALEAGGAAPEIDRLMHRDELRQGALEVIELVAYAAEQLRPRVSAFLAHTASHAVVATPLLVSREHASRHVLGVMDLTIEVVSLGANLADQQVAKVLVTATGVADMM